MPGAVVDNQKVVEALDAAKAEYVLASMRNSKVLSYYCTIGSSLSASHPPGHL
jgi:hypothetical protein